MTPLEKQLFRYLREDLRLKGFAYFDAKYLVPFFTRRITKRVSS